MLNFPVEVKQTHFGTFQEWIVAIFNPLKQAGFPIDIKFISNHYAYVYLVDMQKPVDILIEMKETSNECLVWWKEDSQIGKPEEFIGYLFMELSAMDIECIPYADKLQINYPDSDHPVFLNFLGKE